MDFVVAHTVITTKLHFFSLLCDMVDFMAFFVDNLCSALVDLFSQEHDFSC